MKRDLSFATMKTNVNRTERICNWNSGEFFCDQDRLCYQMFREM